MAKPLKPVSFRNYNGVKIDENYVKKTSVDSKTKDIIITFKTGESLTVPKQDETNQAEVKIFNYSDDMYSRMTNSTHTDFSISNCMGAKFTSSKDNIAVVKLSDCNNCEVDLASNNSLLFGDNVDIFGGENNKVKLDARDRAYIEGNDVKGKGVAAQKDYEYNFNN